jgi:hypothetical protein
MLLASVYKLRLLSSLNHSKHSPSQSRLHRSFLSPNQASPVTSTGTILRDPMAPSQEERLAMLRRQVFSAQAQSNEQSVAKKEIQSQSTSEAGSTIQGNADLSPSEHTTPKSEQILSISDEEDDYVAVFASKAASKPQPVKKTRKKAPRSGPVPSLNRPMHHASGLNAASRPSRLPTSDSFGRPAVGHFCGLNLTAKFPYKYIDDADGTVSRHFFANGKFYERTWDV